MIRSIPFIIAALAEVGVTGPRAQTYAPILQEVGSKHHIDPVTLIVLFDGESNWNSTRINSIGCAGLGQHCFPVCNPKSSSYDKDKCQTKRAPYLSGPFNIRATAKAIHINRDFCNKKTSKRTKKSRSQWRHWLPSYGGYNSPKRGIWCGQKRVKMKRGYRWENVEVPKRIQQYMSKRKKIIRVVSRR